MSRLLRGYETLKGLAVRFPDVLIRKSPGSGGGHYVPHNDTNQRLLSIVGLFDYEVTSIVRGRAQGFKSSSGNEFPTREDAIVGCLATLTIYDENGDPTTITEVGSVDNPAMVHDGEALKLAASDAFKRCAMRTGLGLHIWCEKDQTYFLDLHMKKLEEG